MRLDYIKSLDAHAICLTPIYPSSEIDGGYDVTDFTSVSAEYGSVQDFREMIRQAKKRGLKCFSITI